MRKVNEMAFQLIEILSEQEVCGSFAAIQALRPHLSLDQALSQIPRQRLQGYRMLGLRDERANCADEPASLGFSQQT